MLKKSLFALGIAWAGSASAASASLDEVTMNIVDETAFQEIITADPVELEKLLQAGDGKVVVLRSIEGGIGIQSGAPVTVSSELSTGMVSFTLVCAEGEDCVRRAEALDAKRGFILNLPEGVSLPEGGVGVGIPLDGIPPGELRNVTGDIPTGFSVAVPVDAQ